MKRKIVSGLAVVGAIAILAGAVVAQDKTVNPIHRFKLHPANPPRPVPGGGPQFGDPLDGLTAEQLAQFEEGREEFESIETPEGGVGPIFNNNACAACHSMQASGGASNITVTRFGRRLSDGRFDPLSKFGGTLLHQFAIDPAVAEEIPAQANVIAQRLSTPLFGAGLMEAIPDETIRQNAQRPQPDNIQGRISTVIDVVDSRERIGRFGWKGQHASLLGFAADAYVNEMGITSRFFPNDIAPNGKQALLDKYDRVADPEDTVDPATGKGDIDHAADFIRLLAPPPALRLGVDAVAGEKIFERLNCAACHTPVLFTGPHPIAPLSNARVPLYSDLLLHDMGTLGDGIEQGSAKGSEMKTAPLWGLRGRGPFLHDGRATTIPEAIRAHDGKAAAARDRFNALASEDVQRLLAFLNAI